MKKFICKSLLFCLIIVALLNGITSFVLFGLPPQFGASYQHALSLQYNSLQNISSPKIVVMGDSSVPFSLNVHLMKKMLNMPVQTLGIHSGSGIEYILRLSEGSIHKGDVMVLELAPSYEDSFTPSIVLTACEDNLQMYKAFSKQDWSKVIRYYPSFLIKKVKYCFNIADKQSPAYSAASFDSNGNYKYFRGNCTLPKPLLKSNDKTEFNKKMYCDEFISCLNEYNKLCKKKGAAFLITFPPFLDESVISSENDIAELQDYLSKRLDAPIITKINDRKLSRAYFYNNITHCNTNGSNKVTVDLANEMEKYIHQ